MKRRRTPPTKRKKDPVQATGFFFCTPEKENTPRNPKTLPKLANKPRKRYTENGKLEVDMIRFESDNRYRQTDRQTD